MIGARVGPKGREYLILWVDEIEPGEAWETWEPYERLLAPSDDGELDIHPDIEKQVSASPRTPGLPHTLRDAVPHLL